MFDKLRYAAADKLNGLAGKIDNLNDKWFGSKSDTSNRFAEDDSEERWYTMTPEERIRKVAKAKQENKPFYKQDSKPWE